mmetsp:Transcript_5760/g.4941  ORF Transcript_5760/g.4941 Transcript_5760/m.4941 type:complete len:201 (-) Transcript_5760:89-691(-)
MRPADPIRLIFAISGIKFDDERIQMKDWPTMKESGKFPLKQVPVLEFEDGTMVTQNHAIMRYVASLNPSTGLYPLDLKQRLLVDEIMDIVKDIQWSIVSVVKTSEGEAKVAAQNNLYEKVLPFFFSKIEDRMGKHEYTTGDSLTIGDLALYGIYGMLHCPFISGLPENLFTPYKKITHLFNLIDANPAVKLWREKHEVSQ